MSHVITRAALIGAGTMGAAIAAHLANAGIPVYLLDVVPDRSTKEEEVRGLSLQKRVVRNRLANAGLERAKKSSPPSFFSSDQAELVTTGNTEDNFDWLADADWIVEAVGENLEVKRSLMARVDAVRKPGSVVSTNTSGIPIRAIAEGRSDDFRAHFLGTHFFNPPRYLKLLEVIPIADTSAGVVSGMMRFGERTLGKGVVVCKDTPNFIANRLASTSGQFAITYALEHGY